MLKLHDSLYFTSDIFNENILAVFSTRKLSFFKNDKKIFSTIKSLFPFIKAIFASHQVHGNKILFLSNKYEQKKGFFQLGKADGLIANFSNVALMVFTGDCLPVILSDGINIGIYHAGWRGSLANIASNAVSIFKKFGSRISNIKVAFGPSIGVCCYSINKEIAEHFSRKYPYWKDKILQKRERKIFLDFSLLNFLQLLESGIKRENIDFCPFCTSCDARFFSLRRDKQLKKQMVSFVVKKI